MFINIDNILQSKNKTRYWLSNQTGITYHAIKKLCDNNTRSIQFDMLERLCETLECEPGDILKKDNVR